MRAIRNPGSVLVTAVMLACAALPVQTTQARPTTLTTAFTYQGQLKQSGTAINGSVDLQFKLFDSAAAGAQIGAAQPINAVSVTNGLFTVSLDFGALAFDGNERWLEIGVASPANGGVGPFTTLTPRQKLAAAPYAAYALSAKTPFVFNGPNATFTGGNVGVGTATPADALHVATGNLLLGTGVGLQKQDSGGVARAVIGFDGGDNIQYFAPPDHDMQFRTGTGGFTAVKATLTAGGRLGIGTSTPSTLLHVQAGSNGVTSIITSSDLLLERTSDNWLAFMQPANRLAGLAFSRPGSTATELFHGAILYNETALPDAMQFRTGGNLTRMTITGAGSVGIGTTAPTEPLNIVDAVDATVRLDRTSGASLTASAQSAIGQVGTTNAFPLQFLTNNAARMTVSSAGNIGIGTTSPTARLHVVDATGGNGSVILPSNSISAAEILDEPGCSGLVRSSPDINVNAVFPTAPETELSQAITTPAAGYVLAIATINTHAVSTNDALCRWGLTTNPASIPADQMEMVAYQPAGGVGIWSMPVTLHRLFPVSAGTTTVSLMAQSVVGTWNLDKAQISLIFLPTTYGTAPFAGDSSGLAAGAPPAPVAGPLSATPSSREVVDALLRPRAIEANESDSVAALQRKVKQQSAEIAELQQAVQQLMKREHTP